MKPVVTVAEMREIDAHASVDESVLIERAGWHVARVAKQMMGGCYGRRVVVVAGPGNNGADGRTAAALLKVKGASVRVFESGAFDAIAGADLMIDAAFGTGFHGEYKAPYPNGAHVLAVDIPSGVNGDTGIACESAVQADVTVTFAAYKPGHFLADGPECCGRIELCDIGLDVSDNNIDLGAQAIDRRSTACAPTASRTPVWFPGSDAHRRILLVELGDVRKALGTSSRESHKWKTAVAVVAGSPGMMGAAILSSAAAARSGAGMVRLLLPDVEAVNLPIGEAVAATLPPTGWDVEAGEIAGRVQALVLGPGLGREPETGACVRRTLATVDKPVVVDADGLFALGSGEDLAFLRERSAPTVLTPHEGEFKRLTGNAPGEHRVAQVQQLATDTNAIVLLKGSTTIVASPDGEVWLTDTGSARLATAGTGDVLSGVIGAFLARGMDALDAAAFAAHVHGRAAQRGFAQGLVAGDLPELIARELSEVVGG